MGLFDLLFLALFFTAVTSLLAAGWLAVRRQFGRALRILWRLLLCAGVYMSIVIFVSLVLPRRVLDPETTQCFDDWCIAVAGFRRIPKGYQIDLRLSSRARRVSQRENNLAVYLTDHEGRRYDPLAGSFNAPFNVLLRPQESALVSRSFPVPSEAKDIGLVVTHEGGFPIGWFIIGYDTWFRKPAVVQLR
jgi:hypothetical protein